MIIKKNLKKLKLPDFLIVGAAKAGTTAIYNHLQTHEEIFLSKWKEPHYFAFPDSQPIYKSPITGKPYHPHFTTSLDKYSALFNPSNSGQLLGEASTHYLYYHDRVIQEIQDLYGEYSKKLKIIIIIRNPIERAWSHYMMKVRDDIEDLEFKKAIDENIIQQRLKSGCNPSYDYIGFGKYHTQIKHFKRAFDHVGIFFYEDFKNNPLTFFNDIFSFLGINILENINASTKYNASGVPKNNYLKYMYNIFFKESALKNIIKNIFPIKPRKKFKNWVGNKILATKPIDNESKTSLKKIYEKDIRDLSHIVNRDLSHWLN